MDEDYAGQRRPSLAAERVVEIHGQRSGIAGSVFDVSTNRRVFHAWDSVHHWLLRHVIVRKLLAHVWALLKKQKALWGGPRQQRTCRGDGPDVGLSGRDCPPLQMKGPFGVKGRGEPARADASRSPCACASVLQRGYRGLLWDDPRDLDHLSHEVPE